MKMMATIIKNSRAWLSNRATTKLLGFLALALLLSAIFFREFWRSLPVMLSPDWIFGQFHASPWGILALCLLFLWLKRKVVWAQMNLGTNPAYALLGLVMLATAILVPFSRDFLVFQVLLASLGLFTIIFGKGSRFPAICLVIYGLAVSAPLVIERFFEEAYSRAAITPVIGLLTALGYSFQNQGQWVNFVTSGGGTISVAITAACAGPATMGVFLALFTLMMLDMPLPPRKAVWIFLSGLVGTWFQSFFRMVFLLLVGYYFGWNALQTAHSWTIYIFFPIWFIIFAYVYLRQVKRPQRPWDNRQLSGLPAVGE
ncbi:MAG: exosortase/archaeosortase family protein [Dehalococcoidia bacterium]|nr:MAG: exosortase/archaeosortase family protein [Dehalococcoidia bacterium]